ncbi:MAG: hypothetical protein KA035_02195 [Candidatus Levybacteria bacterium]|nr:hypothetical protein [Candidatus Levybacteria bacterium]
MRIFVLFLLVGFVFLISNPSQVLALTNCTIDGVEVTAEEKALFDRVSNWRVQNKNKPPLQLSAPLNRAASWMAREVDNRTNNGHVDSLGRNWTQRLLDCGYPVSLGTGESIKVNASADEAFNWWVEYTGNAMHATTSFQCGGIGKYGNSWVVTYAVAVNGVCPEPVGNVVSTLTPTKTPIPTVTITSQFCDPDGSGGITLADLRLARREIAGLELSKKASCMTGGSTTSLADLRKIRRIIAGLEVQ